MSASTLILGRIQGVSRPTIDAVVPTAKGPCKLLDAGANVDSRPQHLLEFGIMGSIYASSILGKTSPRVGLLNIGEEETKGTETVLAAFALLKQSGLNFIGNVEGRDLLTGEVDVAGCDGFVGNVLLKFGESMLRFLTRHMREELHRSMRAKLGALLLRPAFDAMRRRIDYTEAGGAPLLGVQRTVVIAHGKSPERAIENAVLLCANLAANDLPGQIATRLLEVGTHLPEVGREPRPSSSA